MPEKVEASLFRNPMWPCGLITVTTVDAQLADTTEAIDGTNFYFDFPVA